MVKKNSMALSPVWAFGPRTLPNMLIGKAVTIAANVAAAGIPRENILHRCSFFPCRTRNSTVAVT